MIVGGAQENTLLTCHELAQRGHDVTLITGPSPGPEGELLADARGRAFRVFVEPNLIRPIRPWTDLWCLKRLKRHFRFFSPTVVHTHSSKGGILGRYAAAAVKVPLVVHTIHGLPFHSHQSSLLNKLAITAERKVASKTDHWISVADDMTRQAVDADIAPSDRFTTIYSGFDVEPYLDSPGERQEMRRKLGIPSDAVVVAKIARLAPLKGHEFLLDAANMLMSRHQRMQIMLIGDGQLRGHIEKRIQKMGLTSRFHLVGLVRPDEIPAYLSVADLLVHTSLHEGLPRTLPQALLAGKPVIAFDLDGAREIVKPGFNGYLVQAGNVEELAMRIERIVTDDSLRERLASWDRGDLMKRFESVNMVDQIEALYRRLLEEKGISTEKASD